MRAVTSDGSVETVLQLDDAPSGLGWTPSGALLVVSMRRRALLRVAGGAPEVVAELGSWVEGPTNDMVVDGTGAAYVGSFGFDLLGGAEPAPTVLLRVAPAGDVREVTARVEVASGLPSYACALGGDDGRTLFVCTARSFRPGGKRSGRIETATVDVPAG